MSVCISNKLAAVITTIAAMATTRTFVAHSYTRNDYPLKWKCQPRI